MNFESPIPNQEREPRFLSLEEIIAKIETFSGKENVEILRTLEDEKGVYLHEVVSVDQEGDASVFTYRRAGKYAESLEARNTVIDVAYYSGLEEEGILLGAATLLDYDERFGQWTENK